MKQTWALLFVFLVSAALPGCGGGGSTPAAINSAATGRATFTIHWPQRSRLIPDASNSIKVTVDNGAVQVAQQLLPRPTGLTSTATFNALPVGTLSLRATAFPHADGSGVAQATATIPLVIEANKTTNFSLTMNSTINTLVLTSLKPFVIVGSTRQLRVSGHDAAGNVVLLSPAKLTWVSSNPAKATVDANGLVTGLVAGNVSITVTDTESGKKATLPLTVKVISQVSFKAAVSYSAPDTFGIIVGDLDGDGNPDVVNAGSSELGVFYGKSDGTLEAYKTVFKWGAGIAPQVIADMDGDGKPDIVCKATTDTVLVFHNLGGRTFASPTQTIVANLSNLTVGDFDRDRRPDLAVTTGPSGPSDIVIYRNIGGGKFQQGASFHNSSIVLTVTAADINGDGKLDLLVPTTTSTVGTSGVGIMYGDGAGGFTGGPFYNTGSQTVVFAVVDDFNQDGKPDILVDDYSDNSISVLLNAGGGTFMSPVTFFANQFPLGTASADFDGDGFPDIVVANAGTGNISYLRNANLQFINPVSVSSGGSNTRALSVADMNRDGKPDVITESENTRSIGVLLNSTP